MRLTRAVLRAAYLASLDRLPFLTHRVAVVFLAAVVATLTLIGAAQFIVGEDLAPQGGDDGTALTSTTWVPATTRPGVVPPPAPTAPAPTEESRPSPGIAADSDTSGGQAAPSSAARSSPTSTTAPASSVCVPGVTCITVP